MRDDSDVILPTIVSAAMLEVYAAAVYIVNSGTLACDSHGSFRGGTRGNAVLIVEKLPELMLTAFTLLVFKNAKKALDCMILHVQSRIFFGDDSLAPKLPGAWTQTPIFAWLVSVPIVPVLRNDHWR